MFIRGARGIEGEVEHDRKRAIWRFGRRFVPCVTSRLTAIQVFVSTGHHENCWDVDFSLAQSRRPLARFSFVLAKVAVVNFRLFEQLFRLEQFVERPWKMGVIFVCFWKFIVVQCLFTFGKILTPHSVC